MPDTGMEDVLKRPSKIQEGEFRKALTKLSSDPAYRERATKNPEVVVNDFKLSLKELQALRQVAVMSGADVKAVNRVRSDLIAKGVTSVSATNVDVSCCSCCCCCCGETAVAPLTA